MYNQPTTSLLIHPGGPIPVEYVHVAYRRAATTSTWKPHVPRIQKLIGAKHVERRSLGPGRGGLGFCPGGGRPIHYDERTHSAVAGFFLPDELWFDEDGIAKESPGNAVSTFLSHLVYPSRAPTHGPVVATFSVPEEQALKTMRWAVLQARDLVLHKTLKEKLRDFRGGTVPKDS